MPRFSSNNYPGSSCGDCLVQQKVRIHGAPMSDSAQKHILPLWLEITVASLHIHGHGASSMPSRSTLQQIQVGAINTGGNNNQNVSAMSVVSKQARQHGRWPGNACTRPLITLLVLNAGFPVEEAHSLTRLEISSILFQKPRQDAGRPAALKEGTRY